MASNIVIVGCGDIGRRVSALYKSLNPNRKIIGLVQSKNSVNVCDACGVQAFKINLDSLTSNTQELPSSKLSNSDLFYFTPPPSVGEQDTRLRLFLNTLSVLNTYPRRIVLISTTGVYGDSKGEWIDETSTVNPIADRAKRRLSAEKTLQSWAKKHHIETMILRVPGIYAKDRLPLARLKKGLPVVNESEAGYTNRIHADDLANACKAAMESESNKQVINVTDGNPCSMTTYFNHIADFSGLPRPPQISMKEAEASLSKGMISYLKESRRIRNNKMLEILKIKLQYPNLKTTLLTSQ